MVDRELDELQKLYASLDILLVSSGAVSQLFVHLINCMIRIE